MYNLGESVSPVLNLSPGCLGSVCVPAPGSIARTRRRGCLLRVGYRSPCSSPWTRRMLPRTRPRSRRRPTRPSPARVRWIKMCRVNLESRRVGRGGGWKGRAGWMGSYLQVGSLGRAEMLGTIHRLGARVVACEGTGRQSCDGGKLCVFGVGRDGWKGVRGRTGALLNRLGGRRRSRRRRRSAHSL